MDHPYNKTPLNRKENDMLNYEKTWKNIKCKWLSQTAHPNSLPLCDLLEKARSQKANTSVSARDLGGRGRKRWSGGTRGILEKSSTSYWSDRHMTLCV